MIVFTMFIWSFSPKQPRGTCYLFLHPSVVTPTYLLGYLPIHLPQVATHPLQIQVETDRRCYYIGCDYSRYLCVCLNIGQTYRPDPKSKELAYDVHFWIGSQSSQVTAVLRSLRAIPYGVTVTFTIRTTGYA